MVDCCLILQKKGKSKLHRYRSYFLHLFTFVSKFESPPSFDVQLYNSHMVFINLSHLDCDLDFTLNIHTYTALLNIVRY